MKKLIYIFGFFLFNFIFTLEKSEIKDSLERLRKEIFFISKVQKKIKNEIFYKKNELMELCSSENFLKNCPSIGCVDYKIILEEFFDERFEKLNFLIDEIENNFFLEKNYDLSIKNDEFLENFIFEEKIRSIIFIVTAFESFLAQTITTKREYVSTLKIGFEIALFIYDLSRFSTEKLFWILERYHHELLIILNKYIDDDQETISIGGKENLGLFAVLKKLKEKKPWTMFILFSFFIYGFYNFKATNIN